MSIKSATSAQIFYNFLVSQPHIMWVNYMEGAKLIAEWLGLTENSFFSPYGVQEIAKILDAPQEEVMMHLAEALVQHDEYTS